ncbi:uncharacterized protein LOC110027967 isoform X2 [Phalaenopsis equestris]|uniref:uncharacterized protein LOC110027967 isoform X2 n=1 Tax=Phalaenopsis equestris TaxID=78828 RepID=UPI0009E62437|nr:uncharacterized protein LOC110027967 isoform X2 [Phalaenopsis equestris]
MQYPLASGEKAMLSLPRLISSPLLAPVLLRRPSTRHQASSKNAILMPGSRARRLVVRMRVSDRENVVEMAGIDRFEIGGVVEDSDPGTAETILRREGVSANLEATLNRSSKWLVAALFGFVILWKHDAEALWAAMGSVLNAWLSTVLKRLLNQDRPSSLKSDPGMPSSHAQSIFYAAVFSVASVMDESISRISHHEPSACWRGFRMCMQSHMVLDVAFICSTSIRRVHLGQGIRRSRLTIFLSRLLILCHSELALG